MRFAILNFQLWRYEHGRQTVPKIFTNVASKHPDKVAFYFENEIWTFRDVEKFSNKIAHFFKSEGYKRGDTIALYLESRPEYVCIWLGLAKIGVVTALVNNNLVADPLLHSIKVSDAKAVILGAELTTGTYCRTPSYKCYVLMIRIRLQRSKKWLTNYQKLDIIGCPKTTAHPNTLMVS